jgi:hypothetical protein
MKRRDFIKLSALAMGSLAFRPWDYWTEMAAEFPDAEKLGRVTSGKVEIRTRPYVNSPVVKAIYDDAIVVWLREVIGEAPGGYGSARWVETPDGYIYTSRLQPVFNQLNKPVTTLPPTPGGAVGASTGKGMWAIVTVPYINLIMRRQLASPVYRELLEIGLPPRIYYSMVVWVDDVEVGTDGKVLYRVNERYGNPGDIYWVPAETLRPLTDDDVSPINPDVTDKRVVVNLTRQTLSCFEGRDEVFFCRVSTGAKFDAQGNAVNVWSTPPGKFTIYRKLVSLHMSGQATGDWPAVAWTSIFAKGGVAIHSTYWHNYFGIPRSHGCVNLKPDDAQWVWRWTSPYVPYEPGDMDISTHWPPTGNVVEVTE